MIITGILHGYYRPQKFTATLKIWKAQEFKLFIAFFLTSQILNKKHKLPHCFKHHSKSHCWIKNKAKYTWIFCQIIRANGFASIQFTWYSHKLQYNQDNDSNTHQKAQPIISTTIPMVQNLLWSNIDMACTLNSDTGLGSLLHEPETLPGAQQKH